MSSLKNCGEAAVVIPEWQSSDLSSVRMRGGTSDERHDCPFMAWAGHHNCAGHAAADLYIGWNDIDVDTHGNTLREPNPFEGRVYIREHLRTVRVVAVGDAAADAVNVPLERWSAAHQVDRRLFTRFDERDFCLLEIAFNSVRVAVDQGHGFASDSHILPNDQRQISDVSIHRST